MRKIVIVGAGISGLLSAWVFRQYGHNVVLLDEQPPGGLFLAGGSRLLRRTAATLGLLRDLDIPYSEFAPRTGVMMRGEMRPFPRCLREVGREESEKIQRDYWRKSRRIDPPAGVKAHIEGFARQSRYHLRCDPRELVDALARRFDIRKERLKRAYPGGLVTPDGKTFNFDYLVLTIPLWEIAGTVWFEIPCCFAAKLNITYIAAVSDPFTPWDIIFTPYTPADCVHRLTPWGDGYVLESSGEFDFESFAGDANFLFPAGYYVRWGFRDLKGHVLPTSQKIHWPDNVAAVGRYAQCADDMRAAGALRRAWDVAEGWFGGKD
jgi:hypothetical protein